MGVQMEAVYNKELIFPNTCSGEIGIFKWQKNSCAPKSEIYLVHNREAIRVKLICYESELTLRSMSDSDIVWWDSCLETFIKPYADDNRYFNIETNPIASCFVGLGRSNSQCDNITDSCVLRLGVKTGVIKGSHWYVSYTIPFNLLDCLFGRKERIVPTELYMNFYKCAEGSKHPHYGMWAPVEAAEPDFHLPQFFGRVVLL